jgi:hypothetical protein
MKRLFAKKQIDSSSESSNDSSSESDGFARKGWNRSKHLAAKGKGLAGKGWEASKGLAGKGWEASKGLAGKGWEASKGLAGDLAAVGGPDAPPKAYVSNVDVAGLAVVAVAFLCIVGTMVPVFATLSAEGFSEGMSANEARSRTADSGAAFRAWFASAVLAGLAVAVTGI